MTALSLLSRWQGSVNGNLGLETSRAWVEIDGSALQHNIQVLRQFLSPGSEVWAVVKANAYGHGAQIIAPEAIEAGAAGICVATLAEGVELREIGLTAPILILGALNTPLEIMEAARWDLEFPLTRADQIPLFRQVAEHQSIFLPIHLNVDTGMTRLGVPWTAAAEIWQALLQIPHFHCRGLYSHLATADEIDTRVMRLQQQRFAEVIHQITQMGLSVPPLHLDNSAAALADRSSHYQAVRFGLAMYGLPPAPHLDLGGQLHPVLRVKARVTHIQTVPAGTGVSYGHRYITTQPTTIATVGIGYADGIPRRLSNCLRGHLRDQTVQQVGTITMDQCMWDVSQVESVQVGDVVELIGGDLSAQQWADQLGTLSYEILCGLSARLPRIRV